VIRRALRRPARVARKLRAVAADAPRWALLATTRPSGTSVRVTYGQRVPRPREIAGGGIVKFQDLARDFPESGRGFNLLYLGATSLPRDNRMLIRLARLRGAPVVVNQDGVAYPGWHGPGWERSNRPLAAVVHAADHVFYQSEFSKLSSDRFLGPSGGSWEILHNAVDTEVFTPRTEPLDEPLTLLLGGTQYQGYRFERAVQTLALLQDARLIVAGGLTWALDAEARARALVAELGVGDRVEFVGPYTQEVAPSLMRRAHMLLHTKVNDPCPRVVPEAMAAGLPVVFSASGGVPELVGDAGIGIPTPLDFERDHPPDPAALAAAVREVADSLDAYAAAARRRAVERFDVRPWIQRHREVFEELVA
jgi:glycosyltransferase involved in cell wall biosynthesis